ncbi:MAG: hypothetical protein L0322_20735, partial [Chloroflexi bacterium]|nr:hypothetical protein [Chloroflexota bacterium]
IGDFVLRLSPKDWRLEIRDFPARYFGVAWLVIGLVWLVGCGQPPPDGTAEAVTASPTALPATPAGPAPTARVLPTLYPTNTPAPSPMPTDTRPPSPTPVPATPVAFDEVVAVLSYAIPGLELNRHLVANVSSQIELRDETTGESVTLTNQAGILLELQTVLRTVTMAELPEGCDFCVQFSYELPLADLSGSGWLTNTQILASVENFTAAHLGPHFPPGTVVGLRRSASVYDVGHTLALTAEGQLWRWTAVEPEVEGPVALATISTTLPAAVEALAVDELAEAYTAGCEGVALETLFVSTVEGEKAIRIRCPELSLPTTLLPVYLAADALLAEKLAGQGLPRPEPLVPLEAVLQYQREDGAKLVLYYDGRMEAVDSEEVRYTDTLTVSQVLTLTTSLLENEEMTPGATDLLAGETANLIVMRGPDGVREAGWEAEVPSGLEDIVEELEALLEQLVAGTAAEPTVTPEATATP